MAEQNLQPEPGPVSGGEPEILANLHERHPETGLPDADVEQNTDSGRHVPGEFRRHKQRLEPCGIDEHFALPDSGLSPFLPAGLEREMERRLGGRASGSRRR